MTEKPFESPDTRILLDPADWLWATWRPRPLLTRPQPRSFDIKQCAGELSRVSVRKADGWCFDELGLPDAMSGQEAVFWFRAIVKAPQDVRPKEFALWTARQEYPEQLSPSELKSGLKAASLFTADTFLNAVSRLVSPGEFVQLLLDGLNSHCSDPVWQHCLFAFHRYVRPFLDDGVLAALRQQLAPQVAVANWPAHGYAGQRPAAFHVASMLGMHQATLEVVQSCPDDAWANKPWIINRLCPHLVVFGLGSADLVRSHAARLRLALTHPQHIRAWLAHTQSGALDEVRDAIRADLPRFPGSDLRHQRRQLFDVLALVQAPQAVGPILELKAHPDLLAPARAWLEEHPAIAIPALLGLAGGRGKLAQAAAQSLWELKQAGHEPTILAGLETLGHTDADAASTARQAILGRAAALPPLMDDATTPDWLRPQPRPTDTDNGAEPAAAAHKSRPLPPWTSPAALPPLIVAERTLTAEQVGLVLAGLQARSLGAPDPVVGSLRQHGDRAALDAFAWRLFEAWHAEGGPAACKWAMHALGLLGSDESAGKLADLIRSWPSEGLSARASVGLDCLRAIGTAGALMQLDAMARKLRFRGLRERARKAMNDIAAARGITAEDLEDLVIPDCGLDSRGHRVFDLGTRSVCFALAEGMKPMLRDEAGKLLTGLPRRIAADDARKYDLAKSQWTLAKKQLSQVVKVQVDRLKKALSNSRRWGLGAFGQLGSHPLMRHLVRAQLWGLYGPGGSGPERLIAAFRVTEEGDWADAADVPVRRPLPCSAEPAGEVRVGLLHPIHLTESQRRIWGEVLSDYEIISPVPQLARSVYPLTADERSGTDITRFEQSCCPLMILSAVLPNMGWQPDARQDAGSFHTFSRPFAHAEVTAVVQHDRAPNHYEDRIFPRLFFIRGAAPPRSFADYANSIRLDRIDPALPSEAMRDIAGVIAIGAKEIAKR